LYNLKAQYIWIPWLDGNPGKKPSLDGKRYAKWSDKRILMKYEDAISLQTRTPGLAGVGFVIPDGYVVVDLDRCFAHDMPNIQITDLLKKTKYQPEAVI
jgi:primase-polymerase (primpol)-like protein